MARTTLKAARGYEFVKRGSKVMLRQIGAGSGGGNGVSINCGCQNTNKNCKIVIDQSGDASCLNDGCTDCAWEVKVPGLIGVKVIARAIRTPSAGTPGRTPGRAPGRTPR